MNQLFPNMLPVSSATDPDYLYAYYHKATSQQELGHVDANRPHDSRVARHARRDERRRAPQYRDQRH